MEVPGWGGRRPGLSFTQTRRWPRPDPGGPSLGPLPGPGREGPPPLAMRCQEPACGRHRGPLLCAPRTQDMPSPGHPAPASAFPSHPILLVSLTQVPDNPWSPRLLSLCPTAPRAPQACTSITLGSPQGSPWLSPTRAANTQSPTIPDAERMWAAGTVTAGGDADGAATLADSLVVFMKLNTLSARSSSRAPWYSPKGAENSYSHKHLQTSVFS